MTTGTPSDPGPRTAFQPTFGQPNVFAPMRAGLVIEDIWPSLYIGADRVDPMRRKTQQLGWARDALARWRAEAETVLDETPEFARTSDGGRTGNAGRTRMFSDSGHHLLFNPSRSSPMWDCQLKQFVQPHSGAEAGWMVLQHERVRRLIASLAFLWKLCGDERFARWAWQGLRDLAGLYEETAAIHDAEKFPYRYVYGGLYEAQCQLQVIQALELLSDVPGCDEDVVRLREKVITPACEAISRWMDVMIVDNMSVWSMAALAQAGRALGREEWIDKALHSERCGLKMLLERGMPRNAETGRPDGFWFEHSPFYGCFYVITAITPLVRAGEHAGVMTDDLRERFATFFDAPPHLVDDELRLLSVSDRVSPGAMRLTEMRHLYEYAAGQIDAKHAGLLALLYQRCGASRNSLSAVAFGPDELPPAEAPAALRTSCVLPEAGLATLRATTPRGGATLWLSNLRRYPGGAQGHHHMDKLSLSLHACGEVITSDLGWPGSETDASNRGAYLSGTFSHNTLMLDEYDQSPAEVLAFEADVDLPVPWAHGSFRGNSGDRMWETFRDHHLARLKEGLYDDAVISRTAWLDWPRVVLLDELDADTAKRFGFAFHARGDMVAGPGAAGDAPLGMPALPTEGAWSCFTGRAAADPVTCFVADWRVRADIYLRLITVSDGPFDAHWGATPDNPADLCRGSLFLRAPGKRRAFATVLEVHEGTPSIAAIDLLEDRTVRVVPYAGDVAEYQRPK